MNNNDEKSAVFNFYDGLLLGVDDSTNGTITEMEDNTILSTGTQTVDGIVYKTVHLVLDE